MTAVGVAVFLVGGGLVLLVAGTGSRPASAHASVQTGGPTMVVATRDLTAGTSGDDVVREKLVVTKSVNGSQHTANAISSIQQLAGQVLTADVAQNAPITANELRPIATETDVSSVAVPAGDQAITVTLPAAAGLDGVASPGDTVNVYANVAKLPGDALVKAAGTPGPCSMLVAPNVQVLDVFPRGEAHKAGTLGSLSSTIGNSQVTFLLAVTPQVAQSIVFFASNETLYLSLVPQGQAPTAAQGCSSYAQQVHRP